MAWAALEAYKMSKEYRQEKLLFAQPAFAEDMDDTRKRILKRYSNFNLNFLDEDDSDEDALAINASALEGAVGIEVAASALSI